MTLEHVLSTEDDKGLYPGIFCPLLDDPIAVTLLFIESFPIDNNDHASSSSKNGQRMIRIERHNSVVGRQNVKPRLVQKTGT